MSETKNLKLFKHEEPLETNNNKFDIDKALNENWDKLDDYAGEADKKINLINEIIDLIPKVSNKGESITLENTARAKFKEFKICGNSNQETRNGKNFLNSFQKYSSGYSMIKNGVTYTLLENGTIKVNGTATGGRSSFTFISDNSTLQAGNYTLSRGSEKIQVEAKIGDNYFCVAGYSKNISIVEGQSLSYVALIVNEGVTVNNEIVYAQLEKGSVATEYEQHGLMPSTDYKSDIQNVTDDVNITVFNGLENTSENYEEQSFTFLLEENQKLMKGDYLADDGMHHTRKQIVLDGSDDENWAVWTASLTNVERFYINLEKTLKDNGASLCSHFKFSNINSDTEHFSWSTSAGIRKQFVIFIDKSKATTVTELKTWLSQNPITVEYELAEEEIETYTEVQKEAREQIKNAISYKGQTNITSTNDIKPIFEVEALADIGLLLNNMQAQILAGGE